jgi:8-oxo-dGTP diphosphatase
MDKKPFGLAVKAVICDDHNRCLLIRRSSANRHFVGAWEWPGGKVDSGEDLATALVREVREETALAVEITGLAGAVHCEMAAVHVILLCLEARRVSGEIQLSDEHDQFAWVEFEHVAQRELTPQVKAFMVNYARSRNGARAEKDT